MAEVKVAWSPEDLIPHPTTQAVLFDLDGTLVDSMPANLLAYNSTLRDWGVQLPPEWYSTRFGLPAPQLFQQVQDNWDLDFDIPTLVDRKNQAYLDLVDEIELFPLTAKLLQAEEIRRKIAIVTSSPKVTAHAVLTAKGLDSYAEALIARDDVTSTKPSPDPYILATQLLQVEAEQCLAYEDSDIGLEAATKAGVTGIDVRPVCKSNVI